MIKNIFITGANGNIGGRLCKALLSDSNVNIIACCRGEVQFNSLLRDIDDKHKKRVSLCLSSTVENYDFSDIDTVVHLAFARLKMGNEAIAESIAFSSKLFRCLKEYDINRVIYLSSQGIYGTYPDIRLEETVPAPNSVYSMAKYSVECLLHAVLYDKKVETVILRLDNVIQSQNLVVSLCKSVITNGEINLVGGEQIFSYIDIDDAVNALETVILFDENCSGTYNVGIDCKRYNLLEISQIILDIAKSSGIDSPKMILKKDDTQLYSGMNCKKFMVKFGWQPSIDINKMIKRVYDSVETEIK